MQIDLITLEDLRQFRLQLLEDLKQMVQPAPSRGWLRSQEVRKLLNISHGTLQNMRVNGVLPYKKVGGIMYYKYEDLEKVMNGHKTPAR